MYWNEPKHDHKHQQIDTNSPQFNHTKFDPHAHIPDAVPGSKNHLESYAMNEKLEKAILFSERNQASNFWVTTECLKVIDRLTDTGQALSKKERLHQGTAQCEPGFSRTAIDVLDTLLRDKLTEFNGIEWGASETSVWLVQRLRSLITIERDTNRLQMIFDYFNSLDGQRLITTKGISKWNGTSQRWQYWYAKPLFRGDEQFYHNNLYHRQYVLVPLVFAPLGTRADGREIDVLSADKPIAKHKFDVVHISRSALIKCIDVAVYIIRQDAGILIVDRSDRDQEFVTALKRIPRRWYRHDFPSTNGMTSIFITSL